MMVVVVVVVVVRSTDAFTMQLRKATNNCHVRPSFSLSILTFKNGASYI
jgi:hypothetical protein